MLIMKEMVNIGNRSNNSSNNGDNSDDGFQAECDLASAYVSTTSRRVGKTPQGSGIGAIGSKNPPAYHNLFFSARHGAENLVSF